MIIIVIKSINIIKYKIKVKIYYKTMDLSMSTKMNKQLIDEINNTCLKKKPPKLELTHRFSLIPAKISAPWLNVPPRI